MSRLIDRISEGCEKQLTYAIELGGLLVEERKLHKKGTWTNWLKANVVRPGFGIANANHYMKMFKEKNLIHKGIRNISEALLVVYKKREEYIDDRLDESFLAPPYYGVTLSFVNKDEKELCVSAFEKFVAATAEEAALKMARYVHETYNPVAAESTNEV